jgi:hypothetical protein
VVHTRDLGPGPICVLIPMLMDGQVVHVVGCTRGTGRRINCVLRNVLVCTGDGFRSHLNCQAGDIVKIVVVGRVSEDCNLPLHALVSLLSRFRDRGSGCEGATAACGEPPVTKGREMHRDLRLVRQRHCIAVTRPPDASTTPTPTDPCIFHRGGHRHLLTAAAATEEETGTVPRTCRLEKVLVQAKGVKRKRRRIGKLYHGIDACLRSRVEDLAAAARAVFKHRVVAVRPQGGLGSGGANRGSSSKHVHFLEGRKLWLSRILSPAANDRG